MKTLETSPTAIPQREIQWDTMGFLLVTSLLGLIGMPLYVYHHGISWFDLSLGTFYILATGLSITMGYHRFFAHATYKSNPAVRFLFLFFGAAAYEQSALKWASQHRIHHSFTDTERDPYSTKKGFWHAHVGWLIFWRQPETYQNVQDLQKDPLVMHQHRYYGLWSLVSGIFIPVCIGAIVGHAWGAFFIAVCFRIVFVHHGTFCINSLCHLFGQSTYDTLASAKDHWLVGFVTFGEGYHNFHHRFPSDYRNGVRWFHWDPSKWLIAAMGLVGLANDIKRTPRFRILDARFGKGLSFLASREQASVA